MKRYNIKIKFNVDAPGRYWYLFWIEKIKKSTRKNTITRVKCCFINTSEKRDYSRGYNFDYVEIKTLDIRTLSFLSVGILYDSIDLKIIYPTEYKTEKGKKLYVKKLKAASNYRSKNKILNFSNPGYTPFDESIDLSGLQYYSFASKNYEGKKEEVVLPSIVLCKYLYFVSRDLVFLIINFGLGRIFDLNSRKLIKDGKVGLLRYDNRIIKKRSHAVKLAPFMFIKDNVGIKSLNSISNNLKKYFIDNINDVEKRNKGVYINTKWPFIHDVYLRVIGKDFKVKQGDNDKFFFLVYDIVSISIKDNQNPLIVDSILLEEMYPKNKKKKDKIINEQNINVPSSTSISTNVTLDNVANNGQQIIDEDIDVQENTFFGFDIPVDILVKDVDDPDYNPIIIPSEEEINNATLDSYEIDSNSDYQNITPPDLYFLDDIDPFEFVKQTAIQLKELYSIAISFNNLDKPISSELLYSVGGEKVMIVELCHKEINQYFFYLIEFEFGNTGFIYDKHFNKIVPFQLEIFINQCFESLRDRYKREQRWTAIKRKHQISKVNRNIIIGTSLDHQTKDFTSIEDIIAHSAEKVYKDRILKVISKLG